MHTDSLFYRLFQERPETVLVYKFPQLSRAEIQTMLHLPETDLKKTRFYQEVFREGEETGEKRGEKRGQKWGMKLGLQKGQVSIVLRLLKHRLGDLTTQQRGQVEQLSADDLGTLGEALLDFTRASDLDTWLKEHGRPARA